MRRIKSKTDIEIYVCKPGEPCPSKAICFMEDEFDWAKKLASDHSDPELEKTFWAGVIENKKADSSYSVLKAFPKPKDAFGVKVCTEVIGMLKHGRKPL